MSIATNTIQYNHMLPSKAVYSALENLGPPENMIVLDYDYDPIRYVYWRPRMLIARYYRGIAMRLSDLRPDVIIYNLNKIKYLRPDVIIAEYNSDPRYVKNYNQNLAKQKIIALRKLRIPIVFITDLILEDYELIGHYSVIAKEKQIYLIR